MVVLFVDFVAQSDHPVVRDQCMNYIKKSSYSIKRNDSTIVGIQRSRQRLRDVILLVCLYSNEDKMPYQDLSTTL